MNLNSPLDFSADSRNADIMSNIIFPYHQIFNPTIISLINFLSVFLLLLPSPIFFLIVIFQLLLNALSMKVCLLSARVALKITQLSPRNWTL